MGIAIFLKIGRLGGLLWRSLLPIGEKWLLLHRVGDCLRKASGPMWCLVFVKSDVVRRLP